ncbi:class I SAM-dependent methyltransferase [Candidatus Woesearchaeota archaeon]|nr:class I SAM-dependent methyltransferase [Candidatus Woesearchaeota archaeon]
MNQNELWEVRSKELGASMKAVCIRSFPPSVNAVIHRWQTRRVLIFPRGHHILDIGAGYGRLSKELVLTGVKTTGIDVSPTFAKLYKQYTGQPCLVGTAAKLPFRDSSFDGAIAVVSWRYLDVVDRQAAAREAFRVTKPNGRLVVIEDNRIGKIISTFGVGELLQLFGRKSSTAGHTFTIKEVRQLLESAGFVIESMHGFSVTTAVMPLLLVLGYVWPKACTAVARMLFRLDEKINLPRFSLNVAFVARKPA